MSDIDAGSPAPNGRSSDVTAIQQRAVAELLRISPVADALGTAFSKAGYEIALVGGSVRDALLGRLGQDLDFATSARPEATEHLLSTHADAVWDIGRDFGTIGARFGDLTCEVTTYRSDIYASDSRKPEVKYGDTLSGDLGRRDFTVNAMAVQLPGQLFVDEFDGLNDLAARRLRTPQRPQDSFDDDPLRMMRAARFAAQLEFEVAPDVVSAITEMAERISIVSAERVRDEFTKLLMAPSPGPGLALMVETGLAQRVVPELPALQLEIDEHHHHKDVYEHSLTVLRQAIDLESDGPDLTLRLAALLHDIGKPPTRKFESGGGVSFHHHEVVGARMVSKRLKALRFSRELTQDVARLVELHLRFHGYAEGEWSDSAVRRYVRDAGPLLDRLHKLTRADCTTRNRRKAQALSRAYDHLEQRIDTLAAQEELAAIRPDLNGNEIMETLNVPAGRVVGEAYKFLLELRLDEGPMSKDEAKDALLSWWSERERN